MAHGRFERLKYAFVGQALVLLLAFNLLPLARNVLSGGTRRSGRAWRAPRAPPQRAAARPALPAGASLDGFSLHAKVALEADEAHGR